MLDRAVYLQDAIIAFTGNQPEHADLQLCPIKWEQAKFLRDLLHPFKLCNDRIEATSRPGIDKVFPLYEVLFNELDRISTILQDPTHIDHKWMSAVYPAVVEMKIKLKRYYAKTEHPYVYGNSVILNPKWKLNLFKEDSWEEGSVEKYREQCRQSYLNNYHTQTNIISETGLSNKRPWETIVEDEEDSDQEYEHLRSTGLRTEETVFNEFDHYIGLPHKKMCTLSYWRSNSPSFPRLGMMARDYLAVSATGTGVEGQFSRSDQVMRPSRRALHASTVTDIMTYTDHLKREQREIKRWSGAEMPLGYEPVENSITICDGSALRNQSPN